jgi:lysozyme family protein
VRYTAFSTGLSDMTTDLDKALEFLLEEEGGWSNHPADRGGATMYGVVQATYDSFRQAKGSVIQSVRRISKEEAREVYDTMYWKASGCHKLPWPVNYLVFDAAVNSGPSRGVRWMQQGLGLKADGVVGPATVKTAEDVVQSGNGKKILSIVDARVEFLARLVQRSPSQAAFLLGWWRRTMRVLARALLAETEE